MGIQKYVNGLQHIGIPTNDIEKTIEFYCGLGFEVVMRTVNEAAGEKVAFLRLQGVTVETYQNGLAVGKAGAIDHIALDVNDVDDLFVELKGRGYHLLDEQVHFLPFWEHGVKYFMIEGPNGEKLEFSQRL